MSMPLTLLVQQADSLLLAPPADSSAVGAFSDGIAETGEMLADGQLQQAAGLIWDDVAAMVVAFVPRLIGALIVFGVFFGLYRIALGILSRVLRHSKAVDVGLETLTLKTFKLASWAFIGIMVAAQFGIDVTALLAGLSIAGIAVGFAARDTLENFIAGITILMDRPFRIGDNIQVDGTFGEVDHITLRSTRLRTLNNETMIMPNALMINQKVMNHTLQPRLRIEIPFSIAYREYPAEARATVLALFEGDDRIHNDLPPTVVVERMGESSVDMILRFHLSDPKLEVPVRFEYVEKVREALRAANIEIPFPHLQLHIDGAKGLQQAAVD